MVEKRGHEEGNGQQADSQAKRAKIADGAQPAAAAAPRLSAEMLEKLEKTKKLLQAQKELQEKLKKLPQVCAPPAHRRTRACSIAVQQSAIRERSWLRAPMPRCSLIRPRLGQQRLCCLGALAALRVACQPAQRRCGLSPAAR